MKFGDMLECLKEECGMMRDDWDDKYIYLIPGPELQRGLHYGFGEYLREPTIHQSIAVDDRNQITIGWVPSIADIFATDWRKLYNYKTHPKKGE